MKKIKLNSNEIIILSVVIGVFIALIMGYAFTQKYDCEQGIKVYKANGDYSEFNYLLSFGVFIIVSGISYLFLKRIRVSEKGTNNNVSEIDSYSID